MFFLKNRPYNSITNNETKKKMKLFHTSPAKIEKINNRGRFGEFLFFSPGMYAMTAGDFVSYELELDNDVIIEASAIFYQDNADLLSPLVAEIASRYDVDTETAEKLIDESESIFSVECNVESEDMADASWDIQSATARAAKLMGYRGVKVTDEQGSAYMIDMMGHEAEMAISGVGNDD